MVEIGNRLVKLNPMSIDTHIFTNHLPNTESNYDFENGFIRSSRSRI